MIKKELVILGAGGHAVSVANVAFSMGLSVSVFVDPTKAGQKIFGICILETIANIKNPDSYAFSIAIGDNKTRQRVYEESVSCYGSLVFPVLKHASAIISTGCQVACGTVVMPNSVLGPNSKLGEFCLVNTGATLDHDCVMHDFSSLAPGATIGGAVEIGGRSAISMCATIEQGRKIGNDVVIGVNSYVRTDIPDNVVAYGTPARIVRYRKVDDPYL